MSTLEVEDGVSSVDEADVTAVSFVDDAAVAADDEVRSGSPTAVVVEAAVSGDEPMAKPSRSLARLVSSVCSCFKSDDRAAPDEESTAGEALGGAPCGGAAACGASFVGSTPSSLASELVLVPPLVWICDRADIKADMAPLSPLASMLDVLGSEPDIAAEVEGAAELSAGRTWLVDELF